MTLTITVSVNQTGAIVTKTTSSKPVKTASQVGKRSREKGKEFEREVANQFRQSLYPTKEGQESSVQRSRQSSGSRDGPDVITPHFWVECKHRAAVDGPRALMQAMIDQTENGQEAFEKLLPVAFCKENRKRPVVWMTLKVLSKITGMPESNDPVKDMVCLQMSPEAFFLLASDYARRKR